MVIALGLQCFSVWWNTGVLARLISVAGLPPLALCSYHSIAMWCFNYWSLNWNNTSVALLLPCCPVTHTAKITSEAIAAGTLLMSSSSLLISFCCWDKLSGHYWVGSGFVWVMVWTKQIKSYPVQSTGHLPYLWAVCLSSMCVLSLGGEGELTPE